jgi:hypothetical protein
MLRGLFGGKVADIEIVPDRVAYHPGELVTVTVRLTPARDIDVAECSVSLTHREHHSTGSDSASARDGWAVAGEYVLVEETVRKGVTRQWTVVLPVPRRTTPPAGPADTADERYPPSGADADPESFDLLIEPEERWGPPTSEAPGASSSWVVRCELAGGRRQRVETEVPVVVLAPPGPAPALAPRLRGDGPPCCTVDFVDVPAASVPGGGEVGGRIRLTAREEIDARAVRVDLVRLATAVADERVLGFTVAATTQVSGSTTLLPRQPRELRFALPVPLDASPSVESEHFRIGWLLRAVVDRPRRGDEVWDQPIAVHTAAPVGRNILQRD